MANHNIRIKLGVALALTGVLLECGCASYLARRHLENVAKGWCETIRASQVIPVYPLTEDVVPGDVFLVQTTIESQAKVYQEKGFLSLDDHRTRLKGIQYTNMYFDGYWLDEFGKTPHTISNLAGAGPVTNAEGTNSRLTQVIAPRAAFPTYTFSAASGGGLSLAIPVHGVPVGLNYLRTDKVNGSVTIADAKTYAADEQQLYKLLTAWTEMPDVRQTLSETVRKSGGKPVFLRTVSRVYLTGSVIVSLTRSDSTGAGLKAGNAPKVSLTDTNGNLNTNYQSVVTALNAQGNAVTTMSQAGGAVQYVRVSDSSVTMAEAFDRPLVIGYLGFDAPVYSGGDIGVPIPTFEHLNGRISSRPTPVGVLTIEEAEFKVDQDLLDALAKTNPEKAMKVMGTVLDRMSGVEFKDARLAYGMTRKAKNKGDKQKAFRTLVRTFKAGTIAYVSLGGGSGERYTRYQEAFARACEEH